VAASAGVLRDLGSATRLLILLELTRRRTPKLKLLAPTLGMTVQGVSEYVRAMAREGLVSAVGGEYRATVKGVGYLHEHFQRLREFVDASAKDVAIIDITAAVAGEPIRSGAEVGLFMESGQLRAYPGRSSPSRGIAARAAVRGEDVPVRQLHGIVQLRPGRISIWRLPSAREGGSRRLRGRPPRHKNTLVAVADVVADVTARKLRLPVDIRFAAVPASIEAAQRGRDVLLLCADEGVAPAVSAIEEANGQAASKIPYDISAG
jgi:putative transcriptional regulator